MSASPSTSPQTSDFETLPSWKQEVNARLNAHRTRRVHTGAEQPPLPGLEAAREESRAARVAARVAERYSKAPTYSEMLAAEAANAARAAGAAAQAAKEAHTAAQAILTGLGASLDMDQAFFADEPVRESRAATVAAEEPEPPRIQYHVHPDSLPQSRQAPLRESRNRDAAPSRPRIAEARASDIEDPFEDAFVAAAQPLPAKLLEFPRELVAARKARPRIAEGPLCEADGEPEAGQLRIFEVEPDTISHQALYNDSVADQVLPEWHSIQLDPRPYENEAAERPLGRQPRSSAAAQRDGHKPYAPVLEMLRMQMAPMEDRLMAGIVDASLVLIGFLLFVLIFAACTAHPPSGKPALATAAVLLVAFFALYQWLFFAYADGTPGMRYAKIALCTFDDENPSRQSMRNRVGVVMLSALPFGLGFLWALLDDHRMTWHDRITRTYQRSYR